MVVVRATKKLLDRAGSPELDPPAGTNPLGDWYATALLWKRQAALFVNELTLLPLLVPLAPARTLLGRAPDAIAALLAAHGAPAAFVDAELAAWSEARLAKTANRSLIGMLNEFSFLAEQWRTEPPDLLDHALELSDVPCGPLYSTHTCPRLALRHAMEEWSQAG